MSIDIKHDLLKHTLGDLKLGEKNINTMIAGAKQKSLGMDLQNEGYKNNDLKKKKKKIKEEKIKKENINLPPQKTEKNPIKLLQIL